MKAMKTMKVMKEKRGVLAALAMLALLAWPAVVDAQKLVIAVRHAERADGGASPTTMTGAPSANSYAEGNLPSIGSSPAASRNPLVTDMLSTVVRSTTPGGASNTLPLNALFKRGPSRPPTRSIPGSRRKSASSASAMLADVPSGVVIETTT